MLVDAAKVVLRRIDLAVKSVVLHRIYLVLLLIGRTTQNRSRTSSNRSYYAESISHFIKSVVLRRIDLVLRQIDVLLRIDLVLVISVTERCCSQSTTSTENSTFHETLKNTPDDAIDTIRVYPKTRVQAPRVTFLATYDLSTGSPRNKIYEKKRTPRKSKGKAKKPASGSQTRTPTSSILP